jgi:hypothetical protein
MMSLVYASSNKMLEEKRIGDSVIPQLQYRTLPSMIVVL